MEEIEEKENRRVQGIHYQGGIFKRNKNYNNTTTSSVNKSVN
jgi:hypothetical protein